MAIDCTSLDSYTSFTDYISQLNVTFSNLTASSMRPCRRDICSVLFGVGNGDISGIGVIIAYIIELFAGILLAMGVLSFRPQGKKHSIADAIHGAFVTYTDAAILFTFSIQFAAVVIMSQKDYGIGANNFGQFTIELTWSVALVTMLPLLIHCFIVAELEGEREKKELRLSLICLSWILFLYTLISRMVNQFGARQVGPSSSDAISADGWANITWLCFSGPSDLTTPERVAFDFFGIGGSLFLSVVIAGLLLWELLQRQQHVVIPDWWERSYLMRLLKSNLANFFLVASIAFWGIPQLWAILKFRAMQQALANSIQGSDQDNNWTFGQILSVVVFLPVLVDLGFAYMKEPSGHPNHAGPRKMQAANDQHDILLTGEESTKSPNQNRLGSDLVLAAIGLSPISK